MSVEGSPARQPGHTPLPVELPLHERSGLRTERSGVFSQDRRTDRAAPPRVHQKQDTGGAGLSLVPVAGLLLVGGCAAHVTDLAETSSATSQPTEILVAVGAGGPSAAKSDPTTFERVEAGLEGELVKRLIAAHVAAEPYVPGTFHSGADVLNVSVTDADPGNRLRRVIIGFGAGQATLHVSAALEATTPSGGALLAFATSSNSGYKPGIVVPAAAAAGTGSAIGLAVGGGIDVATSVPSGLAEPMHRTAEAIVDRLSQYYSAVGWRWPAEG